MSDASLWSEPRRGRRGPAPAHDRPAVVTAAVALADAGGIAAVSMRAVAGELGITAGALYRHVSSRDDLLDLMADRALAELRPYPPAGGKGGENRWVDGMLELARAQRALFGRHPWMIDVIATAKPGPESLAWFDACLHVLEPVPAPTGAKFEAIAMMTGVVTLFARPAPAFALGGVDLAPYPHLVAALGDPGAEAPRGDLFERTLRVLLGGLLAAG